MHGYRPLTNALETFWREHGLNHESDVWLNKFLPRYNELVIQKAGELAEAHSNNGRFGLSKIGGCPRSAALKFLKAPATPFTGSTRATFFFGHAAEVMTLASLEAAGITVKDTQRVVSIDPFAYSAIDAMTEIDGEIGPLSIKSAGYKMSGWDWRKKAWVRKGFSALVFNGVRGDSPGYWAQSQAEMYATGSRAAFIVFVAKDMIAKFKDDQYLGPNGNGSLTFYAERFIYDKRWVEEVMLPLWNKAWDAVTRGDLPDGAFLLKTGEYVPLNPFKVDENKKNTGSWDPCSYCDLIDACKQSLRKKEVA